MIDLLFLTDLATAALLLIGSLFTLTGSYGLLKLDNPMSRVHAPTLGATLGVGCLLLASMLNALANGAPSAHEILVMAFLFVTAPISAHFIAKVHLHRLEEELKVPPPPGERTWATHAPDPDTDDAGKLINKDTDA